MWWIVTGVLGATEAPRLRSLPVSLTAVPSLDALRGTTCVVTGGLGFIGSNLVHALTRAGAHVRVVDALVPGHGGDRRNLEGLPADAHVEVLVAEVGASEVADVLDGVDVVFNLAGQVSHTASMREPERDLHLNAMSHARFLEQLREVAHAARVVHASTRQVYGRPLRLPVDEEHPARPVDVNGVAKLAGEQLHMVYAHAHRMAITSLRLTNVYGPRQCLRSDELGFLPVFVRLALQGRQIRLFGDGSQRRDCLHVDDVVDALVRCTGASGVGSVFNIGTTDHHSLADIAHLMAELGGAGTEVVTTEWPDAHQRIDIGSFETDSSAAAAELGWRAVTPLRDGLAQTLSFYREHPWYLSSI
jgi:UDP-glucose 4-epimerase